MDVSAESEHTIWIAQFKFSRKSYFEIILGGFWMASLSRWLKVDRAALRDRAEKWGVAWEMIKISWTDVCRKYPNAIPAPFSISILECQLSLNDIPWLGGYWRLLQVDLPFRIDFHKTVACTVVWRSLKILIRQTVWFVGTLASCWRKVVRNTTGLCSSLGWWSWAEVDIICKLPEIPGEFDRWGHTYAGYSMEFLRCDWSKRDYQEAMGMDITGISRLPNISERTNLQITLWRTWAQA